MDDFIAELDARHEILDLMARYCRSVDRADYAAVRAVYAQEGQDHHTGFSGSADEYVEWLKLRTGAFTGMMHNIGTHTATVDGDVATAETYGTAHHWGEPADDPAVNFTSGFRYLDRLRRTCDGWRIVERFAVREWTKSDAGLLRTSEGTGYRGARGVLDPLFTEGFATHSADVAIATELKQRYIRAVDDKHWEELRQVFTPGARFGGFGFGLRSGAERLIATLRDNLATVNSVHEAFNPRVARFDETTLRVIWEMRDWLTWPTDDPVLNSPSIFGMRGLRGEGHYEDEIVLTHGAWRISRSRLIRSHVEALTEGATHPLPTGSLRLSPDWLQRKNG